MEQTSRQPLLIHDAALAVLSHFRSVNVIVAFDGDLAWYLLHASQSARLRLDVHVEGDWATLHFAIKSLAKMDRRFHIETVNYSNYVLLLYTTDLQNFTGVDLLDDEPPNIKPPLSQRRVNYCKVFFNCGLVGAHNFLILQPDDIPLLPFQLLLLSRMHGYPSPPTSAPQFQNKLKGRMAQDVTAIEAYLDLQGTVAKREPWLIARPQRRHFLRFLTDICSIHPRSIPAVARYIALLPPGYAYLLSVTRRGQAQSPPFNAYLPLTKIPVAVRYHKLPGAPFRAEGFRKTTMQSHLVMSALYDLSTCIRQFGYACYLNGPGDVPWYILGCFEVPLVHCCIRFSVVPVHGNLKVADLREHLCQERLLKKQPKGGYVFSKHVAGLCPCKVVIEEPRSDFNSEAEMGITMDGVALYSPAHLVFNKLSEKRMKKAFRAVKGAKLTELDRIAPGIRAFSRAEMDLRSDFVDKRERQQFDMLVVKLCTAHPEFVEEFAVLGFQGVLEQNKM